jgi:hypothetical protein
MVRCLSEDSTNFKLIYVTSFHVLTYFEYQIMDILSSTLARNTNLFISQDRALSLHSIVCTEVQAYGMVPLRVCLSSVITSKETDRFL